MFFWKIRSVYVAGKTQDFERVRRVQDICRAEGYRITYDWTHAVDDSIWKSSLEEQRVDAKQKRVFGQADAAGVKEADLVIALGHRGLCGTLIEVGMALAWNKRIFLVGAFERDSVFFYMPQCVTLPNVECLHTALHSPAALEKPPRTVQPGRPDQRLPSPVV